MASCESYTPNYFSINDILCTEERVSCKIMTNLPGLGFLDPASDSEDIKAGSQLELPLWLPQTLNNSRTTMITIDIPNIYKEGYRDILEADSCAIVLSKWNPFYYELGMHLRTFNIRETEKITESLFQTLKSRFRLVMNWAQNPISDPTLGSQLPRLERDLFLTGRKAKTRLNQWLQKGGRDILPSEMAANLKKRKRTDYELN